MSLNTQTSVVRAIRRICVQLEDESLNLDKISASTKKELLHKEWEKFSAVHDDLVKVAGGDEEIAVHDELHNTVMDLYEAAVNKLRKVLDESDKAVPKVEVPGTGRDFGDLKMTPLNLKVFDGEEIHWLQFKDLFEAMVHKRDVDSAVKLARLIQCVDSNKVSMVGGVYTGGYEDVWKELKKRYDRPKRLIAAHMNALLELADNPVESRQSIREVIDQFRNYVRAMRVLKLPTDQWDGMLVPLLLRKIPSEAAAHFNRKVDGEEIPELDTVLCIVEDYADTVAQVMPRSVAKSTVRHIRPSEPTQNVGDGRCPACGQGHMLASCHKFRGLEYEQKYNLVRSERLCFNCFGSSHTWNQCNASCCKHCNKKHHYLMCKQPNQRPLSRPGPSMGMQPQVHPRA